MYMRMCEHINDCSSAVCCIMQADHNQYRSCSTERSDKRLTEDKHTAALHERRWSQRNSLPPSLSLCLILWRSEQPAVGSAGESLESPRTGGYDRLTFTLSFSFFNPRIQWL